MFVLERGRESRQRGNIQYSGTADNFRGRLQMLYTILNKRFHDIIKTYLDAPQKLNRLLSQSFLIVSQVLFGLCSSMQIFQAILPGCIFSEPPAPLLSLHPPTYTTGEHPLPAPSRRPKRLRRYRDRSLRSTLSGHVLPWSPGWIGRRGDVDRGSVARSVAGARYDRPCHCPGCTPRPQVYMMLVVQPRLRRCSRCLSSCPYSQSL